jgi:pilus assembly protein CpaB
MRRQTLIILGIAALLGLVAVYLTNVYLVGAERQQQAQATQTLKVAVARVPLPFGTQVTADKVRFVNWPRDSIPPGIFNSIEQLTPVGNIHVALRPMEVGEPILKSKLSGEGGRATLSAILPAEMRAAAIRISDVAGVAGFVLPGDRVDILITRDLGGRQVTDVLLQDVRVIAIDQDANDSSDKPTLAKTATLEVAQIDAQKLALAQTVGSLSLALRSTSTEQGGGLVQTVDANDLRDGAFGGGGSATLQNASYTPTYNVPIIRRRAVRPAPKPAAAPKPVTSNVEVVRGTAGSNYEVGRYGGK